MLYLPQKTYAIFLVLIKDTSPSWVELCGDGSVYLFSDEEANW